MSGDNLIKLIITILTIFLIFLGSLQNGGTEARKVLMDLPTEPTQTKAPPLKRDSHAGHSHHDEHSDSSTPEPGSGGVSEASSAPATDESEPESSSISSSTTPTSVGISGTSTSKPGSSSTPHLTTRKPSSSTSGSTTPSEPSDSDPSSELKSQMATPDPALASDPSEDSPSAPPPEPDPQPPPAPAPPCPNLPTINPKFTQSLYQTFLPAWPIAGTTLHLGIHASCNDDSHIKYHLESPFDFVLLTSTQDIIFSMSVSDAAFVGPNNVMLFEVVAQVAGNVYRSSRSVVAIVFPMFGKENNATGEANNLKVASHHHDQGNNVI